MRRILLISLFVIVALGIGAYTYRFELLAFMATPSGDYDAAQVPPAPDYADPATWMALPDKQDSADQVPAGAMPGDNQARASADAFFVHPTTYIDAAGWNAPWDDKDAAALGATFTQAAVFNGCCRVYAPEYRQATLAAFAVDHRPQGRRALDLAYGDVERAFRYYLAHWNQGRPFILASHSQGTVHLQRLLAEVIAPDPALRGQLIAAYAIGYPLPLDRFDGPLATLKPCAGQGEVGCVLAWSSFARDGAPAFYRETAEVFDAAGPEGFRAIAGRLILCVNPVSFRLDGVMTPREANRGGTVHSITTGLPEPITAALVDAQCVDGILRISEPEPFVFRTVVLPGRDYHAYDYALFWQDVRLDAVARTNGWFGRASQTVEPEAPAPSLP